MKAIDLIAGVLKAYDLGMKPFCDLCIYPADYDSFEDWQLKTMAKALATTTTLTGKEALAALRCAIHKEAEATLIGVPCSCKGMTDAIGLGLAAVTTVTFDGKTTPSVGILTHETFSPFQWCPWCGNAAIEIKEAHNDEERT